MVIKTKKQIHPIQNFEHCFKHHCLKNIQHYSQLKELERNFLVTQFAYRESTKIRKHNQYENTNLSPKYAIEFD